MNGRCNCTASYRCPSSEAQVLAKAECQHMQMNEDSKSGIGAADLDVELLRLADWVFTHVRDDLREEGKAIARDVLERTQDTKATVRSYVGVTLLLSSLTAIRLHQGPANAQRYLEAITGPMQLICKMPWPPD
jgi:hypothetical protein